MSDESDVTGNTRSPGPTMEDLADILARQSRGLLAIQSVLAQLRDLLLTAIFVVGFSLFLLLRKKAA